MTTYAETTRNRLRALLGTNKVAEIDTGFLSLAEDVDSKMASYWQDTFAKRPAAGQPNRIFKATDTGLLYHDTGTVWEQILGPGAATYEAGVSRSVATLYEPSATRTVEVVVRIQGGEAISSWVVNVGGVLLHAGGGAQTLSHTFTCTPATKWEVQKVSGTIAGIFSSYRPQ